MFVLQNPKGDLIDVTADPDKSEAQAKAFNYLYSTAAWAQDFWKDWDGFIRERRKRGFKVVHARLSFLGNTEET